MRGHPSMSDAVKKFIVLIPLRDNAGMPIAQTILDEVLEELFALAGGYTIAGRVSGAYRMSDGSKQQDELLELWVGVPAADFSALREIVAKAGEKLGQESMYLEETSGTIEFVLPNPGPSTP